MINNNIKCIKNNLCNQLMCLYKKWTGLQSIQYNEHTKEVPEIRANQFDL